MANGNPKFGSLDVGQSGGTRQLASTALFTGRVMPGGDETVTIEHKLPQQQGSYLDNLGYKGATWTWEGVIRTSSASLMRTIIAELNERKHGSGRDGGELAPFDATKIEPQQLTDYDGTVLSGRAVLTDWRSRGPRMRSPEWAALMQVTIIFRSLC